MPPYVVKAILSRLVLLSIYLSSLRFHRVPPHPTASLSTFLDASSQPCLSIMSQIMQRGFGQRTVTRVQRT